MWLNRWLFCLSGRNSYQDRRVEAERRSQSFYLLKQEGIFCSEFPRTVWLFPPVSLNFGLNIWFYARQRALSERFERKHGCISDCCWIAAGEACICRRQQNCFNYWDSSAKIHIEEAFGILVARWGIFCRTIRLRIKKWALVIVVCRKLHNTILETSGILNESEQSALDNIFRDETVDSTIHLQDTCDTQYEHHHRRRELEREAIRNELTNLLEAEVFRRLSV